MVSFSTLQRVMERVSGIEAGEQASFASRLRHLNTMAFPPMGSARRGGGRFDYGASELAAVALVFEMGQAFIAPAIATRFILDHWPELTRTFGRLAGSADTIRRPTESLVIWPRGLANPGAAGSGRQGRGDEALEADIVPDEQAIPVRGSVRIVIDLSALYGRIRSALSQVAGTEEVERFGEQLARAPHSQEISARLDGRRGWFVRRAIRLLTSSDVVASLETGPRPLSERDSRLLAYLLDPLRREQTVIDQIRAPFAALLQGATGSAGDLQFDPIEMLRLLDPATPDGERYSKLRIAILDHLEDLLALLEQTAADVAPPLTVEPRGVRRARARSHLGGSQTRVSH